ncbi:hypothetical protein M433DRAFT_145090 [Acidomyces richmondensis BFW]|nr:MAG: hypothetical protein FE78DRAFT_77250 [Acidomyces sp. 'richmondensis']KYG44222.1 hypothetical protein M433DRAFT_145090 [Acidomyces richmondensis BFW]
MILATAAVGLGRKIADERKAKKEARQGLLSVGDSEVAKRAFAAQTKVVQHDRASSSASEEDADVGITRKATEIKFEDPNSFNDTTSIPTLTGIHPANIPPADIPGISSPIPEYIVPHATRTQTLHVANPLTTESASIAFASPAHTDAPSNGPMPPPLASRGSPRNSQPLPYSPAESSTASLSQYSRDTLDTGTIRSGRSTDASSVISGRSASQDGNSVRVRTRGASLDSGFPYHPALFELSVHPTTWDSFTTQLVEATKLDFGDHAQMWAAATGVAMTGALVTSVFVGRNLKRRIQENKVKAGLADTRDGGLGSLLRQWNETYFHQRGLIATLELSQSAMKHQDHKSSFFRRETHWYASREERERKKEERKFVIVVTKVNEEDELQRSKSATRAFDAQELPAEGSSGMPEMPGPGDPKYDTAEMPGNDGPTFVELPGDFVLPGGVSLGYGNENLGPRLGYAELDGETAGIFEKSTAKDRDDNDDESQKILRPPALMVTADTHAALN